MAIPSEYSWIENINELHCSNINCLSDSYKMNNVNLNCTADFEVDSVYGYPFGSDQSTSRNLNQITKFSFNNGRITIRVTSGNPTTVQYDNFNIKNLGSAFTNIESRFASYNAISFIADNGKLNINGIDNYRSLTSSFQNLSAALNYIYNNFANIDLYVDNDPWIVPTPPYNWQSVPSISGKNGILNLAQIKAESINDGEPVSGASDSAFTNMSDDNNVATLVDVGELNNNKAKVVYNIPALTSGNYSYAKLVYKQGFIPTSKDDGTAVDLDLTDLGTNKTITVSNIVSGSVYWFVIFTDKSESDAVSLGENTEGVFFELDLTTDGRDVIRYNPAKEFLGAKQGELVGNNFTISDGVLDTSYDVSWYYDPAENPKSIPADCTLTFEYDTFFPNGEGYLDWYIIDSDDTQRIYWCFDTQYAFQSNKWYNCKTVAKVENGKITRYKYVLDDVEISCSTANIKMPCTDASDSVGIEDIHFRLTRPTKMKNISIYYDFSTYTDGSGGGGSGGSGASGSNPVS